MKLSNTASAILIFCITAALFICFTNLNTAGFFDGDSVTHYLISRYAVHHPYLFLLSWGKPFFVLFSCPFSQAGFRGIQFFNIICAGLAALFTYKSAIKLKLPLPAFTIFFLIFTPVYFVDIPTGLTEVFFSLVIILSFYLFICQRYILAALLVSFLPLCRTEGFFILPVFFAGLALLKQYKAIPLLGAGGLIYSTIGYAYHYHDFLWIVHQNPYHVPGDMNEHGNIFHFVSNNDTIFGPIMGIGFILGLVFTIYGFVSKKEQATKTDIAANILLYGCFIVFYGAVSWWKWLYGSYGLNRVMTGIAPMVALGGMQGLAYLWQLVKNKNPRFYLYFMCLLAGLTALTTRNAMRLPVKMDRNLNYVKQAAVFILEKNTQKQRIYYTNNYIPLCMDVDPYDNKNVVQLGIENLDSVPAKSIILWETAYGPNEAGIPQTLLQDTQKYVFLKKFSPPVEPDEDVKKRHFEADVYQKK